jgi:hypothetical protein
LIDHVETHLHLGHLLTLEVDAYFLPDRVGTSYRAVHDKTTIAVTRADRDALRAEYFHGRGHYGVDGDDFAGVFRLGAGPDTLPPYVELVNLEALVDSGEDLVATTIDLARAHLSNRPGRNPVHQLAHRVIEDADWLGSAATDAFHPYAFGTLRQFGAWASTTSEFVVWLATWDPELTTQARRSVHDASIRLAEVSNAAKRLQFKLARASAGRKADLASAFENAAQLWQEAFDRLTEVYLHDEVG